MRLLLQRVQRAEVRLAHAAAGEPPVGRIDRGLLVLVGIGTGDGDAEVAWAAAKVPALRLFGDEAGKMNLDLIAAGGALLAVSQFTLYGDVRRGRRPGFSAAAPPGPASEAFDALVERWRAAGLEVATGAFGAAMHVELLNDGPVTIWLDSAEHLAAERAAAEPPVAGG